MDAVAGGVAADRELVVAGAETGLVAAVGGVAGAEVAGQIGLLCSARAAASRWGQSPPAPTGWVLVRVADGDQPRAGGLDGGERGRVVRVVEASAASSWMIVVSRPSTTGPLLIAVWSAASRVVAGVDAGVLKIAREALGRDARRCW